MNLKSVLSARTAAVGLVARDKTEIIDQLLEVLDNTGLLENREAARAAVLERERKMSTGMKNGIAIPHGKTDAVKGLVACVAVSAEPIDFDSLDGLPSRIFIMTLSPPEKTGPHLQFLAEASQLFKSEKKREAVIAARTAEELVATLLG
ncbi:MAG: PTS sugar transporter subunit IIA [Spirochaetales bacterium]|nr:MAG: PTS sugar transporter subunit IIA [Spirochaetales bacterium]